MKLLYIGYLLNEELYQLNPAAMFSAGIFEEGMLYALQKQLNEDLEVLTLTPNRYYPEGPLMVRFGSDCTRRGVKYQYIPYINLKVIRQVSAFFSLVWAILQWCYKNRGHKRLIVYYNLGTPFNEAAHIVRPFIHGIYPIVCDYNIHDSTKKGIIGLLQKRVEDSQAKYIGLVDGVIVLNQNVALDFHPKRYLVMEGAISTAMEMQFREEKSCVKESKSKISIRYAGTIDASHGSETLIELAEILKYYDKYEIQIAGKLFNFEQIQQASNNNTLPLHYVGMLDRDSAVKFTLNADILIIPHSTRYKQLRYQFSSKMFDYMACEIPVVVAPMPGFPEEYKKYVFVADADTVESYMQKILEITNMPKYELELRLRKGKNFVIHNRTWKAQVQRIIAFIEQEDHQ